MPLLLVGCCACDLNYCADCELVTLEIPTEQLTKPEMLTEQPTKLEMPMEQLTKPERLTEQQLMCTHLHGLRSENQCPHCCVCGAKAQLGCASCKLDFCFNCMCTHKLQSGHLHPHCRTCRDRAQLGCRICDLNFCLKCMHAIHQEGST